MDFLCRLSVTMRTFILLFLLVSCHLRAEPVSVDAWARATPPAATTGAVYGTIGNDGEEPLVLDSVQVAAAKHTMIHRTVSTDGMMKMEHADVSLQPGESVTLVPGGLHIMLMGLSAPLVEGCRYSMTLRWAGGLVTSHEFVTGGFGQQVRPSTPGKLCP